MGGDWWQGFLRALRCDTRHFDLVSPRRREECVRLLRDSTNREWTILGSRRVMGDVTDTAFSLRRRIFYHNPLQTIVRGELLEESRATRLPCSSAPPQFALWFNLVCLGGVVPIMIASIRDSLAGLGVPLLMCVFFVALIRFCRFLARNEERYLVEFLAKTLDARQAS
jgi:hypothetical protein